jgi:hypothetical protein
MNTDTILETAGAVIEEIIGTEPTVEVETTTVEGEGEVTVVTED